MTFPRLDETTTTAGVNEVVEHPQQHDVPMEEGEQPRPLFTLQVLTEMPFYSVLELYHGFWSGYKTFRSFEPIAVTIRNPVWHPFGSERFVQGERTCDSCGTSGLRCAFSSVEFPACDVCAHCLYLLQECAATGHTNDARSLDSFRATQRGADAGEQLQGAHFQADVNAEALTCETCSRQLRSSYFVAGERAQCAECYVKLASQPGIDSVECVRDARDTIRMTFAANPLITQMLYDAFNGFMPTPDRLAELDRNRDVEEGVREMTERINAMAPEEARLLRPLAELRAVIEQ